MQRFDLFNTTLAGWTLIEASAGTGKTHTITDLYLRLVLESGLSVNHILVVTYTNAATCELRDRIRKKLVDMRDVFMLKNGSQVHHQEWLQRYDHEHAARRLTNAVRGFDEAAIFTIHGFCQRVLKECALLTYSGFDMELMTDEGHLLAMLAEDFWRKELYGASANLIDRLLDAGYSPATLLRDIKPHIGKHYAQIFRPPPPPAQDDELECAYQIFLKLYQTVRALWLDQHHEIKKQIHSSNLNRKVYPLESITTWLAALHSYLRHEKPPAMLFKYFEKFTLSCLEKATKKNCAVPHHVFFEACEALQQADATLQQRLHRYWVDLRIKLLDFCNQEIVTRKLRQRRYSYDDLLTTVHRALNGQSGEALADYLRRRYQAALIDEFQDTDPLQYAIFQRIYAHSGLPVFLVGDPKQAIYSFRRADIFTYLEARKMAQTQYTLTTNWRSDPALIKAFNAIFDVPQPFLLADIPCPPSEAAVQSLPVLKIAGQTEPPFAIWFMEDTKDKAMTKEAARELAAEMTAAEITHLLNLSAKGDATLGDRPVEGADIAILVRTHEQGRSIRRHLLKLGVPCVQRAQDNVFDSPEAVDLERLLLAIAQPHRERLVRAALTTDLLGTDGATIERLYHDDQVWENRLQDFHYYHLLWQEQGFIRLFRTLIIKEGIAKRLLSFRDGERRLTNLLHLGELLHTQAHRMRLTSEALLTWYGQYRRNKLGDSEEEQLHLESDEHLVQIVTVHKSKGMQYPIVFCPFIWDSSLGSEDNDRILSFHDPEQPQAIHLDVGSEYHEQHRYYERLENYAENLRLAYVALTRAKHRCYLAWGAIKKIGTAAPAWLWHRVLPENPLAHSVDSLFQTDSDPIEKVAQYVQQQTAVDMKNDLAKLIEKSQGAITLKTLPELPAASYCPPVRQEPPLQARHFVGNLLRKRWQVSSFSALATGLTTEAPDYDVTTTSESESLLSGEKSIFTFPRGARAGRFWHALFEQWDFIQKNPERLRSFVARTLVEHGFEREWVDIATTHFLNVLATPLLPGLSLNQVPLHRRLNELEFHYPVIGFKAESLGELLTQHRFAADWGITLKPADFSMLPGYLKGFIDLIFADQQQRFYIADYKSNWLGKTLEAYRRERLYEVIIRELYYLQYLIYTVALHRYLQYRLPNYRYERHFGGVFYLFIRGMNPAHPNTGVFYDRPPKALIEAIDQHIARHPKPTRSDPSNV